MGPSELVQSIRCHRCNIILTSTEKQWIETLKYIPYWNLGPAFVVSSSFRLSYLSFSKKKTQNESISNQFPGFHNNYNSTDRLIKDNNWLSLRYTKIEQLIIDILKIYYNQLLIYKWLIWDVIFVINNC